MDCTQRICRKKRPLKGQDQWLAKNPFWPFRDNIEAEKVGSTRALAPEIGVFLPNPRIWMWQA